jgi:hypothetical protein
MRIRPRRTDDRGGFGKLEALLVIAFLSLLFQVFPTLWTGTLYVLDVRNWGRWAWLALNFGVIFALFAVRFGPELMSGGGKRKARKRPVTPEQCEKQIKDMDLKAQRELFQRMQEARKKQII